MKTVLSIRGIALAIVFGAACFRQAPLVEVVPTTGTRIVALVTDSGAVTMGNAIGPGALEVEGIVVSADATTWSLHLLRVDQRGGISTAWNSELVTFPRNALTNISVKRIDRKRSWLAAGLITGGAILAARLFGLIAADEEIDRPPVPPN